MDNDTFFSESQTLSAQHWTFFTAENSSAGLPEPVARWTATAWVLLASDLATNNWSTMSQKNMFTNASVVLNVRQLPNITITDEDIQNSLDISDTRHITYNIIFVHPILGVTNEKAQLVRNRKGGTDCESFETPGNWHTRRVGSGSLMIGTPRNSPEVVSQSKYPKFSNPGKIDTDSSFGAKRNFEAKRNWGTWLGFLPCVFHRLCWRSDVRSCFSQLGLPAG